jgi:FtsZ-binding cell division protein ZapB
MDLPHGLKGKVKPPVPTQDALQFKVEEVMEKKEQLKEEDIFETPEQFNTRVKKRHQEAIDKNKKNIIKNKGKTKTTKPVKKRY